MRGWRTVTCFQGLGKAQGWQQWEGEGEFSREMASAVGSLQSVSAVVSVAAAAAFFPVQWVAYYSLIRNCDGWQKRSMVIEEWLKRRLPCGNLKPCWRGGVFPLQSHNSLLCSLEHPCPFCGWIAVLPCFLWAVCRAPLLKTLYGSGHFGLDSKAEQKSCSLLNKIWDTGVGALFHHQPGKNFLKGH